IRRSGTRAASRTRCDACSIRLRTRVRRRDPRCPSRKYTSPAPRPTPAARTIVARVVSVTRACVATAMPAGNGLFTASLAAEPARPLAKVLIGTRPFGTFDDERRHWPACRLELQPELL